MRSMFCTMVARVPWEHEAQFESDVFNRGILSIGNNESEYLSCACTNDRYLDEYPPRAHSARGRLPGSYPGGCRFKSGSRYSYTNKEGKENVIYCNDETI